MAVRDFPSYSLQRGRYANNKIKKFHMETVWAWPCIGWIGITHGNLIYMKFDFSTIPHCLWCITEWNSSSWNSLFCLFLNFTVKHIHAFSPEQQILEQSIRKNTCILHVLKAVSIVGLSFAPPSTIFTSFSSSGNTLGLEKSFLLSKSAPISLWANPAWNLSLCER